MQMPPDFPCDSRAGAALPLRAAALPDQSMPLAAWNGRSGYGERTLDWLRRHEGAPIVGTLIAYVRVHASQLIRFVLIGAILAALNLAILYCLRTGLRLPDPMSDRPALLRRGTARRVGPTGNLNRFAAGGHSLVWLEAGRLPLARSVVPLSRRYWRCRAIDSQNAVQCQALHLFPNYEPGTCHGEPSQENR